MFFAAANAAQATERIYVTQTEGGLPVYTNRPLRESSQLVAILRPPLNGSVGELAKAAIDIARSTRPNRALLVSGLGIDALIQSAARIHGVEEALLRAVIDVESRFNPAARSPKGAMGLMQLMPGTARRYGVTDAHDPAQNIEGGTRYLKDLIAMFQGNMRLALAAYNAGEGAVIRYGHRIPPFAETQAYVPAVLARYQSYAERARAGAVSARKSAE